VLGLSVTLVCNKRFYELALFPTHMLVCSVVTQM